MSTRKSSADRRDFLKATAVAAGAVTAAGLAPTAFAAGNDVIKVGLIGCGGRGTGAVRNIHDAEAKINGDTPKVEIVAVGDVFKSKAKHAVDVFNAIDFEARKKDLISTAKDK